MAYAYDLMGRLTGASFAGYSLSFSYDALGRNTAEAGPLGTIASAYDAAGRRTLLSYPGATALSIGYAYNLAGEMTEIRENPSGGNVLLASYAYDDRGRRSLLTRGNGTTTSYGYDPVSRLDELAHNLTATTNDLTLGFSHNPASQIVSNTRSNDAYSFTGHANVNLTASHNGLNQVITAGGAGVSHDARGNVIALPGSVSGTGAAAGYDYTAENRLLHGPNQSGYAYDPLGRLYAGFSPSLGGAYYVSDGGTVIAELASGATLQRRYVHGPGVDEPLVWYEGTGLTDRRWFHADERGSVIAVSDGSGNLVGTRNRYDEYGVPQAPLTGRFGYTGQMWLPEVALYYYRARMYNPSLPRFMQADPIGYWGGMNLYAYVGNDPVNFVDPLGLDRVCWNVDDTSGDSENNVVVRFRKICVDIPGGGGGGGGWSFSGDGGGGVGGGGGDNGGDGDDNNRGCPSPPATRTYPVPPGHRATPMHPNHTFVLDSRGSLVMNPHYQAARVAAGAPSGPAGWRDLLGPNPGSVAIDLLAIAISSVATAAYGTATATSYTTREIIGAVRVPAVTGSATAAQVSDAPTECR